MANRYLKDPRMLFRARSVLVAARDLLSDRRRWTQGAMARDGDNESVGPLAHAAERWCAVGAIDRASHEMALPFKEQSAVKVVAHELVNADLKLSHGQHCGSIMSVNDGLDGYERIMRSFSRLIYGATVATLTRRSEAAMKGWETRRRRARAATAAPVTMTIAGTLPAATTDANSARLEIVHVQ